jgi:hypothetical protein
MTIVNVQDTKAPFMLLQDSTEVLPWHEGVLLSYRLRAHALQVTSNTIQMYATDSLYFSQHWKTFECTPTAAALCMSYDTSVALMGTTPVTTPRDVASLLAHSALLREFNGIVCSSDHSGRTVGGTDVYTVSMCDLVDGQLRFVLHNSHDGDVAYWIRDTTGAATYVALSIIALYTATSLAQNITSLISKKIASPGLVPPQKIAELIPKTVTSPFDVLDKLVGMATLYTLNVLACVVSVVVLIALCDTHVNYYVLQHDVTMYYILLLFLVADLVLLCLKQTGPREARRNFGHQIGISTAVLLLVTLRLHNTFDTPFLLVLNGIFGIRVSCKIMQHIHDSLCSDPAAINLVSVLLDLFVWCSLLAYSLEQCSDAQHELAIAAGVVVALLLGLGMSILIAERAAS